MAGNAAPADTFSHGDLVSVDGRRVDVPVSGGKGFAYGENADFPVRRFESAETGGGNLVIV